MNRNPWSRLLFTAMLLLPVSLHTPLAHGQDQDKDQKEVKPAEKSEPTPAPKEESSVTEHSIKIAGQVIPYKATVGSLLLKNEKDEPEALMYYTAYTRSDIKDVSQRPLAFLYNGGPGSASIWLHMGAFGPKRVVTANAAMTPPPPYQLEDNPDCLLDKADLVFIDPVGTGFSKAVGKAQDKEFWGVDQDAKSIVQFIRIYLSRNQRWNSSKFLIGESYGTFRNAVVSNLLGGEGIYLNGIVMMSTVWDLGTLSFYPGQDLPYILYLPSYAATAWFHKTLKERPDDVVSFVDQASTFAQTDYANALLKGDNLSDAERAAVAKKLSYFTGLSEDYLIKSKLRVRLGRFQQELQLTRGLTTGRLDARFSGPTYDLIDSSATYDPQEAAIMGPFVAAFNLYLRQDLKFGGDKPYHVFADFGNNHWDWKHQGPGESYFPGSPNVMGDLANALITNPKLQVQLEIGYYDLATPMLEAEYAVGHLELPETLRKNIQEKFYQAGHMMYLRPEDLPKLKDNIGAFIDSTTAK